MGCIHSKQQLLNEEDLNYIARNTAMDKAAVEVNDMRTFICIFECKSLKFDICLSEAVSKLSKEAS